MFTVALIGSDGAGKTTIGRRLAREMPQTFKYVYMGVNMEASNMTLPTTRLLMAVKRLLGKDEHMGGPPDPSRKKARPKGRLKRALSGAKSLLRLTNRLGEEWFRQIVAWNYLRQGYTVLFDRHFYSDYYAHDIAGDDPQRPLSSRIHGFVLDRLYPKPDLIILLDAPAELLFARKGEGTPELLERRRQEYLQLRERIDAFAVVDASQDEDVVAQEVAALIERFGQSRGRRRMDTSNANS